MRVQGSSAQGRRSCGGAAAGTPRRAPAIRGRSIAAPTRGPTALRRASPGQFEHAGSGPGSRQLSPVLDGGDPALRRPSVSTGRASVNRADRWATATSNSVSTPTDVTATPGASQPWASTTVVGSPRIRPIRRAHRADRTVSARQGGRVELSSDRDGVVTQPLTVTGRILAAMSQTVDVGDPEDVSGFDRAFGASPADRDFRRPGASPADQDFRRPGASPADRHFRRSGASPVAREPIERSTTARP